MTNKTPTDENITMLLNMGFYDIEHVRKALTLANNDVNEAVSILTGESNKDAFEGERDVEMNETLMQNNNAVKSSVEVVDESAENIDMSLDELSEEFPVVNLYELEDKVFTDSWWIPYKKDESLAKCLYGATKLASMQKTESDANCDRFVNHVLPECIKKLTSSQAARKWNNEIQEGVFNMLQLFVDFAAIRLSYQPIPTKVLQSLVHCFDPDSVFHFKNRLRKWDRKLYEDLFGYGKCPAVSPQYKEPFGWLVNLVNRFAWKNGLSCLINQMNSSTDICLFSQLWRPLGFCAPYLNKDIVAHQLSGCADDVVKYVTQLSNDNMKEKEVATVFDLLFTLYEVSSCLWSSEAPATLQLHLATLLQMLSVPHFNARMNAVKELCRLIRDAERNNGNHGMARSLLSKWMLDNKVISIIFKNSLHHDQYCEKLKRIVEFVGSKITLDELTTMWKMQQGKHVTIVDNIHSVLASAAHNFTAKQTDHLITLLETSFNEASIEEVKTKEGLLEMISKIGRELKDEDTIQKFLKLLWDFWHQPELAASLVDNVIQVHLDIFTESLFVKTPLKLEYINKCVNDIRNDVCVVPAIQHILQNLRALVRKPYSKNSRSLLQDVQKQHDLLKLLCKSLRQKSLPRNVHSHLHLIEFFLDDGGLFLNWNRCKEIWDCLMLTDSSEDHKTGLEWFINCIKDLSAESQKELFLTRIVKSDVNKISEIGFHCFKAYFEVVNMEERKLRRSGDNFLVDKQDLTGLAYLLQLILESPFTDIAQDASHYFIKVSYECLSTKVKQTEVDGHHRKFILDCHQRLSTMLSQLNDQTSSPQRTYKSSFKQPFPIKTHSVNRELLFRSTARLLDLVSLYIRTVEEACTFPRSFPPHGSCYYGSPVTVNLNCVICKFQLCCHSNEKFLGLRQKIAKRFKEEVEDKSKAAGNVEVYHNGQKLTKTSDHKVLHQLGFTHDVTLNVKMVAECNRVTNHTEDNHEELPSPSEKPSSLLEQEKCLPGYMLAFEHHVFDILYQLVSVCDFQISHAAQKLLSLLPTDSDVLHAIDIFSFQSPWTCSPGTKAGYTQSSENVLQNYFKCSAQNMSTFRVLYNLQVLSSKLMPVLETSLMTGSFRQNWLNAGGLRLIMSILLPGTLPADANYELRQSCYFIILQLARFLLCGETSDHVTNNESEIPADLHRSASAKVSTSTPVKPSCQDAALSWPGVRQEFLSDKKFTPENGSLKKRMRSASVVDQISPTVKMVIENLNEKEFTETISSLMQVAWASGSGQLQLQIHKDVENQVPSQTLFSLKPGVCLQQEEVSSMDSILSNNSLELLVMCLQLRVNFLSVFYKLMNVAEFIVDLLTASSSEQVRCSAVRYFATLAQTQTSEVRQPKLFLLETLLKAQLPFWSRSAMIRGNSLKILHQSRQYFELLCIVFQGLSLMEQQSIDVDVNSLLQDQLTYLTDSDNSSAELLVGHLKLTNVLYSCESINMLSVDSSLIRYLLNDFLFCSAQFINQSLSCVNLCDLNPVSYDVQCRQEAFNLLLTLATRDNTNLEEISADLRLRHHVTSPTQEWNFEPLVCSRPVNGFVGLKNAGATCYMNSVLQQFFMQPGLKEMILKLDDMEVNSNVYHFQVILGHLLESQQQFYTPEAFWRTFKLWGEHVNVREQQDAFEFYTNITDQLNEHLKMRAAKNEIFSQFYGGKFVDQKICQQCSYCSEREEVFSSVPVTVKCGSLEASLDQFISKEVMEDENAYFCEKCCKRRTTVKRTYIKTLPPVLVFQLKRFWYDWERNRAIKFDDLFSFPWLLNVEPYTKEGISKKGSPTPTTNREIPPPMRINTNTHIWYELVGIVVHSGQASAGHYYSFIKNRQSVTGCKDKWYKFNDSVVELFDMTDEALCVEAFGGEYKVPQTNSNNQYPENRVRNWNAYMLFYETMEKRDLPRHNERKDTPIMSCPSSPGSSASSNPPSPGSKDGLNLLSALIRNGECRGLFKDNVPAAVKRLVNEENLKFMQQRDVFNLEYFAFIRNLCSLHPSAGNSTLESTSSNAWQWKIELAVQFLFNTYLRMPQGFRLDMDQWHSCIESIMEENADTCSWLVEFFSGEQGKKHISSYLLECPDQSIREFFNNILFSVFKSHYSHDKPHSDLNLLMLQLFSFLESMPTERVKRSSQFFELFCRYANLSCSSLIHLAEVGCFQKFYDFLIGEARTTEVGACYTRRWCCYEEFLYLYSTLIILVVNTDLSVKQTVSFEGVRPHLQSVVTYDKQVSLTCDIEDCFYGVKGILFLEECLHAAINLPQCSVLVFDMLAHACWCNTNYSLVVIKLVCSYLAHFPTNDLKELFTLTTEVLSLPDDYQELRVMCFMEGVRENHITGVLALIQGCHQTEARRAYQCVKYLVRSSNKFVRRYLLHHSTQWQWAVDWLRNKMSEYSYWSSQLNVTNDNHAHTSFQRTTSAQHTLAEATKLLTEIETCDEKKPHHLVTSPSIQEEETQD